MIDAWMRTPERDSGTGKSKRRMSRCEEPLIVLFHHRHNLAHSPPISSGDRDAEQLFSIRSELRSPYPLRRVQIENPILESISLAITLDAFKGAQIEILRHRS